MNRHLKAFRRALRSSAGRPLAYQIEDGFGAAIYATLRDFANPRLAMDDSAIEALFDRGGDEDAEGVKAMMRPIVVPGQRAGSATAVIPVRGVTTFDIEYQPLAFSTAWLAQVVDAMAADPDVGTIILDIDTPGGQVTGTPEAAEAVYRARGKKRVAAVVSPLAASAGYWIASQATTISMVPSGAVGSIGVFMAHMNCGAMMEQAGVETTFVYAGEHKIEGNSMQPLSEESRAHFQSEVDQIHSDFVAAVARGRGVTPAVVRDTFGRGRTVSGKDARRLGMVDSLATRSTAFARLGLGATSGGAAGSRRAEDEGADVVADVDAINAELEAAAAAAADGEGGQDDDADEPAAGADAVTVRARRLAILRA